jgi:hypothetical protein
VEPPRGRRRFRPSGHETRRLSERWWRLVDLCERCLRETRVLLSDRHRTAGGLCVGRWGCGGDLSRHRVGLSRRLVSRGNGRLGLVSLPVRRTPAEARATPMQFVAAVLSRRQENRLKSGGERDSALGFVNESAGFGSEACGMALRSAHAAGSTSLAGRVGRCCRPPGLRDYSQEGQPPVAVFDVTGSGSCGSPQ